MAARALGAGRVVLSLRNANQHARYWSRAGARLVREEALVRWRRATVVCAVGYQRASSLSAAVRIATLLAIDR